MPIYEYKCEACVYSFDMIQDEVEPYTSCPKCNKNIAKRVFTAPSIHFKGDGWVDKEIRQGNSGYVNEGKKRINEIIQGRDAGADSKKIDDVKEEVAQKGGR